MPTLGEFKYDNLFAGDFEIVTDSIEVNAKLTRGAVLALVDGKAVSVDSTGEGDVKIPYAILAEDAEKGENAVIYLTGEFNSKELTFGGSDVASDHKTALRNIGIFLKENV